MHKIGRHWFIEGRQLMSKPTDKGIYRNKIERFSIDDAKCILYMGESLYILERKESQY